MRLITRDYGIKILTCVCVSDGSGTFVGRD